MKLIRHNNKRKLILESQESKSISATKKLWAEYNYPEDKFEYYLN